VIVPLETILSKLAAIVAIPLSSDFSETSINFTVNRFVQMYEQFRYPLFLHLLQLLFSFNVYLILKSSRLTFKFEFVFYFLKQSMI
jgi:hypothetical protein